MSVDLGLQVRGLYKRYNNGVQALLDVNLGVEPGIYGLLGPNGAGKSTLMRILATLQEPDAGSIHLDGVDVLVNSDYMRRRLGYLPQKLGAYPGVSARDLLDRFAWLKGCTHGRQRREEIERLLCKVSLQREAHRALSTYSEGMLRRFGIAMALVGSPQLLIVDEPTAGLTPIERNCFHRVLADVALESIVLLSTHIVEDIESLCSRLAVLVGGQIIVEGRPADLLGAQQGRLWEAPFGRGEPLPDALHVAASPEGNQVIVYGKRPVDPRFTSHTPRLEDIYYLALAHAGEAFE